MSKECSTNTTIHDVGGLAAAVVAAYVSNNSLAIAELPDLIASIYATMCKISGAQGLSVAAEPAVLIKKSVTRDFIVCLEDGKKYRSLRRHLQSKHDLTPEAYRTKGGLLPDYPMVAPGYAEKRSALAKASGLGRKSAISGPPSVPARKAARKRSRTMT